MDVELSVMQLATNAANVLLTQNYFNFQQKIDSGQSWTGGGETEHLQDPETYSLHQRNQERRWHDHGIHYFAFV